MQAGGIIQSLLLKHFVNVVGLRHVHRQTVVRGATPHRVDSQMVGQGAHEVDLQLGSQGFLKPPLSLIVGPKVGAVINTGSKVNFPPCWGGANEQTQIVGTFGEAQVLKNPIKSLAPMTGASPEPTKCLSEAPIGCRL